MNEMKTIIETNTTALSNSAREAACAYYAQKDSATIKAVDLAQLKTNMDNAISQLNEVTLHNAYKRALAEEAPISALCKAYQVTKFVPRNTKNGVSIVGQQVRVNILDFLAYCEENHLNAGANAEAVKVDLSALANVLAENIRANIHTENGKSTKDIKSALEALCKTIGAEGVHGRSKDARFLTYAVTKAKKIGELQDITAETVAPYLSDVFMVQLRKVEYKFESEANEEKKAEEKK